MKRVTFAMAWTCLFLLPAAGAQARDVGDVPDDDGRPVLFHWPLSQAVKDSRPIRIAVEWDAEWDGREILLHHRNGGAGEFAAQPFVAGPGRRWEIEVPAALLAPPTFEYWIESVEADGSRVARFGSAGVPQVAAVRTVASRDRFAERLAGHGGRRAMFDASFRHHDFGRPAGATGRSIDSFNVLDLSFTYRLLKPGLYSVSMGVSLLGDRLGVDSPAYTQYPPGAYAGYLKAYWEFGDIFGVEPMLLIGASPEGFEGGGGLTLRFGPVRATHFDLAFWGLRNLGWTFLSEFVWTGIPHVVVALRNELTTAPVNEGYGIVPAVKITGLLPAGLRVHGLIGYGIREGYDRGWLTWGAGLGWEF